MFTCLEFLNSERSDNCSSGLLWLSSIFPKYVLTLVTQTIYILMSDAQPKLRWMSFYFNNSSLARSDNNQHNDSQTYCDALFIFFPLCLITRYQLTTLTPKCVWITGSEEGKGENDSYIANLSCKGVFFAGNREIHWLTGSIVHKHTTLVWHGVYPEGGWAASGVVDTSHSAP